MDVDDAAAREYFVKLVALQLVITGAAGHHYGFDVQVIERIGHAVEQHAVVGDHFVGFVKLPRAALRIAAAQIARRQHRLHARMPKHGLRGQAHLAKKLFRPATRKIKHRFGVCRVSWVADDGHVVWVFNIQQGAGGFLGQAAGHFLVDEVDNLLFDGRFAHGGGWFGGLLFGQTAQQGVAQVLGFHAPVKNERARSAYRQRVGQAHELHGHCGAGVKALFAHLAQQVAHIHGHFAKVNVHRAGREAFVAQGAVVGHVFKLFPVFDGDTAPRLLFV